MAIPTFKVPGPCQIAFNTGLPTIATNSLGETQAGVIITTQTHLVPITCDEFGDQPVDFIFTGKSLIVECLGMDAVQILTQKFYRDLLGKAEAVGNIYSVNASVVYQLLVQENVHGGTATDAQWLAKCVHPIMSTTLPIQSSKEFTQPLRFQILPDTDGNLFATIPTYLV